MHQANGKVLDSPVEVWFVFVHIDVVERILSEPGVDGESILVRPFGYWWQCNGLWEKTGIYITSFENNCSGEIQK